MSSGRSTPSVTWRCTSPGTDPVLVTYHDGAWCVRADLTSQGGLLCCVADRAMLEGRYEKLSQVHWSCCKPNGWTFAETGRPPAGRPVVTCPNAPGAQFRRWRPRHRRVDCATAARGRGRPGMENRHAIDCP